MKLKTLFSVPDKQNITEKHLYKVLISSICSILVCLSCLAGTTWAWFVVSIEDTENVIQIGEPQINVTVNGEAFKSGSTLTEGKNVIVLKHAGDADDFDKKSILYVTLSIEDEDAKYVVLEHDNEYRTRITIDTNTPHTFSWIVSWFIPDKADELTDKTIQLITEEEPTEESEPEESESKETEPKETEPKETEPKETEPKETEPKETEPKETEPKETEPKETEPKETEPKETEPKETEPKETEPKETEPKETEPKETEPKETEPKETEPKETEPKETEPKATEPEKKSSKKSPESETEAPAETEEQTQDNPSETED